MVCRAAMGPSGPEAQRPQRRNAESRLKTRGSRLKVPWALGPGSAAGLVSRWVCGWVGGSVGGWISGRPVGQMDGWPVGPLASGWAGSQSALLIRAYLLLLLLRGILFLNSAQLAQPVSSFRPCCPARLLVFCVAGWPSGHVSGCQTPATCCEVGCC